MSTVVINKAATQAANSFANPPKAAVIDVAVAVLHHSSTADDMQFLLAKRHKHQHQGDKLEFVGGKIEAGECAKDALVREVFEEIGLSLQPSQLRKFGVICHHYDERSVRLHIFRVALTNTQFIDFKDKKIGAEGQTLHWLPTDALLDAADRLPAANVQILRWLDLPKQVVISRALADFAGVAEFVAFYCQHLPQKAHFYLRACCDDKQAWQILQALKQVRADVQVIAPFSLLQSHSDAVLLCKMVKLTCDDLACVLKDRRQLENLKQLNRQILVSVHHIDEARLANQLNAQVPLAAAFVSPINKTATHPDALPLGWTGFADLAQLLDMPSIALGGLSVDDLAVAVSYGAAGISGIRGFERASP